MRGDLVFCDYFCCLEQLNSPHTWQRVSRVAHTVEIQVVLLEGSVLLRKRYFSIILREWSLVGRLLSKRPRPLWHCCPSDYSPCHAAIRELDYSWTRGITPPYCLGWSAQQLRLILLVNGRLVGTLFIRFASDRVS